MDLSACLQKREGRWVLDLRVLTSNHTTRNDILLLSRVLRQMGSFPFQGHIALYDGRDFDQPTGYWIQKIVEELERATSPQNSLRQLAYGDKVQWIAFAEDLPPAAEEMLVRCQQALGSTSQPKQVAVHAVPAHASAVSKPGAAAVTKPRSESMSNFGNISLKPSDSGWRHIYHYYIFDIEKDEQEVTRQGAIVVRGDTREEAEQRYLVDAIRSLPNLQLTENMHLKIRWVTSFQKPKKEVDANAKLADAIRAIMKEQ